MRDPQKRDYQTLCLFLVLGGLTAAFVFLMKVVLFSPVSAELVDMATK